MILIGIEGSDCNIVWQGFLGYRPDLHQVYRILPVCNELNCLHTFQHKCFYPHKQPRVCTAAPMDKNHVCSWRLLQIFCTRQHQQPGPTDALVDKHDRAWYHHSHPRHACNLDVPDVWWGRSRSCTTLDDHQKCQDLGCKIRPEKREDHMYRRCNHCLPGTSYTVLEPVQFYPRTLWVAQS